MKKKDIIQVIQIPALEYKEYWEHDCVPTLTSDFIFLDIFVSLI
jgi:hypothetical protein